MVGLRLYKIVVQIKASDIAFWDKDFTVMQRKHDKRIYPPRVKITISFKDPSLTQFVLPVQFVGCSENELDTDLSLPLGIYGTIMLITLHKST